MELFGFLLGVVFGYLSITIEGPDYLLRYLRGKYKGINVKDDYTRGYKDGLGFAVDKLSCIVEGRKEWHL